MNDVLFVQNCFCPDQNQFDRLKRSLRSLIKMTQGTKPKPTGNYWYVLSGWVHEDFEQELENIFEEELQEYDLFFRATHLDLNSENIGKGKVNNEIVKYYSYGMNPSHLFLFDNDIIFKNLGVDQVQILIEQQQEMNSLGRMKYPVISFNFEEHQVHNMAVMDKGFKTKHGLVQCSTGRFGCLGGGAWIIEKDHWDEIGGYCDDTIYGKDDGKFYLDTIVAGKMVCLSVDHCVIHPADVDQTYNIFKADTNVNRVRNMNYDELSKDSNNFWSNR